MPRFNSTDYRNRRAALRADWEKGGVLLARLTIEQRDALRAFYLFDSPLRSSDFASARNEAIKRDPNLVRQSGLAYRAFASLKAEQRADPEPRQSSTVRTPTRAASRRPQKSTRRIAVFSETNPSVDPDQMAWIIIAMAREQLPKKRVTGDSGLQ